MKTFTKLMLSSAFALVSLSNAYAIDDPTLTDQNGSVIANKTMLLSSDKLVLTTDEPGGKIYYGIGTTQNAALEDYGDYAHLYTGPISLTDVELDSYKSFRIVFNTVAADESDESDGSFIQIYIFDDPTSLTTDNIEDIKALSANTNVTYNMTEKEGMVAIESSNYRSVYAGAAPNVYLWNGTTGFKLKGGYISKPENVVDGTVQYFIEQNPDVVSHTVTGTIRGSYTATSTNAGVLTSNQQSLATQAHTAQLTVGEAKTVEPIEVSIAELLNPTKNYTFACVKVYGKLVAVGTSYVGLQDVEDPTLTINLIDDEYYIQATTGQALATYVKNNEELIDKTGTFVGIIASSNGNRPSPIGANWFTVGMTPTDIQTVNANRTDVVSIYNLSGQRTDATKKGLYISNGKKFVVK